MLTAVGQTLSKVTKVILLPVSPLQHLLDSPGITHIRCLEQAYHVLALDSKEEVAALFQRFNEQIVKGLYWADRGWKNVCHFYSQPDHQGTLIWPGAAAECQFYFNKAVALYYKNTSKSMFYLGASLHLIQDMCVPHHSVGALFDGHQEFEKWVTKNAQEISLGLDGGLYLPFTHPSQWIDYNATISAEYYSLVSLEQSASEESYAQAARQLLPLTINTTAGFLEFMYKSFQSKN